MKEPIDGTKYFIKNVQVMNEVYHDGRIIIKKRSCFSGLHLQMMVGYETLKLFTTKGIITQGQSTSTLHLRYGSTGALSPPVRGLLQK